MDLMVTMPSRMSQIAFRIFLFGALILGGPWSLLPLEGADANGRKSPLSLTEAAPDFHLPDVVNGQMVSRDDFKQKKALLVTFICRHCPYVQHIKEGLSALGRDYAGKDIAIIAISSNDPEGYKEDHPDSLKEMAVQAGFVFPFLFDETQEVAKAFTAAATPDFFLFDEQRRLVYRGQFDDSRPGSQIPVTGKDVRSAIEAVLNGQSVSSQQKPAIGCSIKWKPENQQSYWR